MAEKTKNIIEEDNNIYKFDLTDEQNKENTADMDKIADEIKTVEEPKKEKKKAKTSNSKRTKKTENIIKVIEDEDSEEEIDDIFGNVNKWLSEDELEEKINEIKATKRGRKKTTKIEEGIESSKKKTTQKSTTKKEKDEETKTTKTATKKATTRRKKKAEENIDENAEVVENTQTEVKEIETKTEAITENNQEQQGEIKIHAENDITELLLKHSIYRVELQKLEYNIYTQTSDNSYIIVRSPILKILSENTFIVMEKQDEDYAITTNQDFKINYVIDNLERKENVVNFKLTNLTEIIANEEGLEFIIDEEKVIENNLEDNHTLVISEEDGKVYLPYTKEDIKREVGQNKGSKISEIIENKYTHPLDKYKNSIRARFREGYNLMYRKEKKSKRSAILLGIELMFETNLHPAIISACKNLEELDIYLDCLDDNELEKFSCFKIIYKSLPALRKKVKFREI